jgi:hypothetical protein
VFLVVELNLIDPIFSPPAIPNDPSSIASSSPYPSRPDSATYYRPELPPSAYSLRPPQPAAVFGMCNAHPVPTFAFHFICHLLGAWPHARSPGIPTDDPHPQHEHLPPANLSHPAFCSPIQHPSMLNPYRAAHSYPPPAAPLPESPIRKRVGPEETQTPRSKCKRLGASESK